MTAKQLTPAQDYMKRMIEALDGLIENPNDPDWEADVVLFLFERPKTLRSALSAALYKSVSSRSSKPMLY